MHKGDFSSEAEVYGALSALAVEFVPQHPMLGFVVDAFLPRQNIVIECQGDYFHCNPSVYPDGHQYPLQRRAIARDERKRAALQHNGCEVVELWEADIRREGALPLLERALLPTSGA